MVILVKSYQCIYSTDYPWQFLGIDNVWEEWYITARKENYDSRIDKGCGLAAW
jgi:hypothetical protein